ncbi:hypothetical protein PanWU01x14_029990 [Parasponia andersonii]|uniref:Uncharacterized protein n=1 Tax=Parasponia andersonii TaxID=3476 RepID=A0A2P5DUM0_PARAD|nr:hypothetical protein PanWU01x14_029990 [Parasponia andersonii]
MALGIGRRGRRGRGRGSYVTQGGRGSSATQGGHGNSDSQGGRGSSGGHGSFSSQGGRGSSTSLGGLGDSTSPSASQQRMGDPLSSQTPSCSTAYPSATTSGSGAVRGPTCGKKTVLIAKSATGGKLPITFEAPCRQPICVNAERFNNEMGYIENFDINLRNETTLKCIDEQMRKAWKGHKYKLHTYFKDIGGEDDEWSAKNTEARSKRKWGSRNGLVSTPRHHIRCGEDLTSTTGQIETWRERHYDPDKGWIWSDLESIYDCIIALRAEHTPVVLSDKDIMECTLGCHSVYFGGWDRSPSRSTATSDMNSGESRRPTYDELAKHLTSTQQQLFENSGPATRIPPTTQRTFEHDDDSPGCAIWQSQSVHVAALGCAKWQPKDHATWRMEAMPRGVTMSCHEAAHVCAIWQLVVVPCGCTRSC